MANSLAESALRARPARRAGRPSCTCASTATRWWRPTSRSAATTGGRASWRRTSPTTARRPRCCAAPTRWSTWRTSRPPAWSTPAVTFNANMSDELQRLPRGRRPRPVQGGVGVKRDHPRPAVRPRPRAVARRAWRTPLRPGRRGPLPLPVDDLRPVQGRQRDDRRADLPLVRHPVRRPAHLQHHGAPRLPALPLATGPTRTPASGTCGATSTSATSPPPAASAWRPT